MAGDPMMGTRARGNAMTTAAALDSRNRCGPDTSRPLAGPHAGAIGPSNKDWGPAGPRLLDKMPRWIYSDDFTGRNFAKLVVVAAAGRQWDHRQKCWELEASLPAGLRRHGWLLRHSMDRPGLRPARAR